jgi:hypothetical protein
VPARIVGLIDQHPHAAVALAVPGTIVGIASVAAYPFVFVALLVLFGVALVVMDLYNRGQRGVEQRTQVTAVREKRNYQQRAGQPRAGADQARAPAARNGPGVVAVALPQLGLSQRFSSGQCDTGIEFIRPRLELEAEAKAAEALAAKAEALAAEVRARAIRLRLQAEARAN